MQTLKMLFFAAVFAADSLEAAEAWLGSAPRVDLTRSKAASGRGSNAAAAERAAGSGNWIDTSIRSEVATAWNSAMVATNNIAMGWTGSVAGCNAGTTSATWRSAVGTRINWFRGMAGVPTGVTFNDTWYQKDQQAALMMSANRALDHFPPSSWTCFTAAGEEAAGNSNLCYVVGFGNQDPGCVALYVNDPGSNNTPVGHRRWLLYPQTREMATGDVSESGTNGRGNAIWVIDGNFGGTRPATRDDFVAWPPKGYVPYQAVYNRWSFSYPDADFTGATIAMTRSGASVGSTKLRVEEGFGENTVVWEPNVALGLAGSDTPVDVTISNVLVGGQARSFSYRVIVFDPSPALSGISVTITSVPAGLSVTVDGNPYTTPAAFTWQPGGSHTFSAATTQDRGVAGERFVFLSWSNGPGSSQTVSPTVGGTYTATFATQYSLQTSASPAVGGTITVSPGGGWYAIGQIVTLNANASGGYSFSNWSGDASGSSPQTTVAMTRPAAASATFTPATVTGNGYHFVPVSPCRIADTREAAGTFGGPVLAGGVPRAFPIPQSRCGIPATAKAYSLNVTVVPTIGLGYLTIWPTDATQPFVSTLNAPDAQVTANAAIVPAGANGAVSVFVTNTSHLVLDINGYFDEPTAPNSLAYYPVTPCRIADTREATGSFGGPIIPQGGTRTLPVRQSACGLPSTAAAYAFNVTVVPPVPLGYITAWPAGQTQPFVSTTNSLDAQVTANMAIVPAGTNGSVSFFASNQTHLVVDVMGYFAPPGAPNALKFFPVTPCRIADTRNANGALGGPVLAGGSSRSFPFTQAAACGLPATARAYSANFTVVPAVPLGYLTTWPAGSSQPFVSTLNSPNGQITANAALVPAGTNGAVSAFVTNQSHIVIDTNGYFAP